jgi:hypothetical protein
MNHAEYIVAVHDAVPAELCDRIVTTVADSPLWVPAEVEDEARQSVENRKVRNCDVLSMIKFHDLDWELVPFIGLQLNNYLVRFPDMQTSGNDTGFDLLRYTPGGFYKRHVDYVNTANRVLSVSLQLNDDFEGGEFQFWGNHIVPQRKGTILLFPSAFCYPHEVLPVRSGVRYSMVTWFL